MEVVDAPLELLQRLLGREPTTARSLARAGAPRRRPRPRPSFRGSYLIESGIRGGLPTAQPLPYSGRQQRGYGPRRLGQTRAADALGDFRRDHRVRPSGGREVQLRTLAGACGRSAGGRRDGENSLTLPSASRYWSAAVATVLPIGASLRGSEGLLGLLARFVLVRHVGQRWRLGCRLGASLRRSEVLLGLLTRFVSIRHVGQGRPGLPEAHEPSAGQQHAGTGIRAGHSERGSRRPGAASKQEDQRGRAGCRSERSEERTSAHHGDPRTGLACPSGQIAPRSIHLLAS